MRLLRPHRFLLALAMLAPASVEAAPASKKPAPAASASRPLMPVAKSSPSNRGATAHRGSVASPQRSAVCRSIGSPTEGHLVGGAHLGDAPYLRIYPFCAGGDVRWGIEPLVGLIDRAAKLVRKQYPDAVLSVGHLSKNGGGELDRHASHESGRDADIGFFVKNAAGKPLLAEHMVAFTRDGTAPSWPGAIFDEARNWALVAAMVGDGHARVTHIFVATPIRERLLAYAATIGAPPSLRSRASQVLAQPHGALPHDDHFHVRIGCPSGMGECIEQPTARSRRAGGAVASHGHAAHPSHGTQAGVASRGSSAAAGAHVSPGPVAPSHPPAPASKPGIKPVAPKGEDAETERESFMPSLAPVVPGLDSAVIPAPLGGIRSTWGTGKDAPPTSTPDPKAPPISDPDGILEGH